MAYKKVTWPFGLSIVLIAIFMLQFFNPTNETTAVTNEIATWLPLMVNVMLYLGLINIVVSSINMVRKREKGKWYFALYRLAIIFVILGAGILTGEYSTNSIVLYFFNTFIKYAGAILTSMSAIFLVICAYRGFRVKSVETVMFLAAAVATMFNKAPVGPALWDGFTVIGSWLDTIINKGVVMQFTIATGIIAITFFVQYLMGKQLSAIGGRQSGS